MSRFVWGYASRNQKAHDFIHLVTTICTIRVPKLILTDRYPGIKCKAFESFLDSKGIGVKYIFTQCPHSNGIVERVNQTLINKLRCAFNESGRSVAWDRLLPDVIQQYNNTIHSTTGYSPRFLLLGFSINGEVNLTTARAEAFTRNQDAHKRNKELYDKQHKDVTFQVGDLVWLRNHYRKKLDPLLTGPHGKVERVSSYSYKLDIPKSGRRNVIFHVSHLKPVITL